jgi:CO/xanthine dehydrogenase Mo-binding subunit
VEKPPFVDDITIKHCLWGILLRSPVSAGDLKAIRTPRLPSGVSLVQEADIPGKKTISCPGKTEIPVFSGTELLYYGQPVALLLGPDPAKLRELADQCTIIADPRPEGAETALVERNYTGGDTKTAFEKAVSVVEGTYVAEFLDPWPSDPLGVLALPGPGPSMVIHAGAQWPGFVRNSVARVLNIKDTAVQIRAARLEIHLDGRIWPPALLACQAAVGALIRDRPVKLVLTREEDFLYSPKTVRAEIQIQSALNMHKQILGSRIRIRADFGAYGIFAGEILDRIALGALGAYNHGSIQLMAQGCSGPIPPAGPLAGFGLAQGFFAAERHASQVADTLGEDPAEWRKNFFLRRGKKLFPGIEIREEPPLEELLDTVAIMSDYRRKWAANELLRKNRRNNPLQWKNINEPFRGIGITLAYQGSSFLYEYPLGGAKTAGAVEVTLEKDGVLEIRTNFPWGENQIQGWKALGNHILGVENLRIRSWDTEKPIPESGAACLSRGIATVTLLVEKACTAIRKQRFRDPLPITVRRYYHPAKVQAWGQSAYDENALAPLSWGSAVVEVEIDPVEYVPKIRGTWIALEGGTILTEPRARKSIRNSCTLALSWAMGEKIEYPGGKIDPRMLKTCRFPRMGEIPPPGIDFLWSQGPPKGIGELPFTTLPGAYAQALSQALDYPFQNYPVDSQDIWTAIQNLLSAGIREGNP